ncbi:MAG: ORF6N domain-containing protein [Spirochaetia bacterium]|nr:ORF6N domain-containing protein [Spirochaetia bacterium]
MNELINIENKILVIRGQQVMLDRDLAEIYGYEVKALNQQVKRNISRFPDDFMFELTREEIDLVKSQIVTSPNNNWYAGQEGGRRKPPLAFTEQGVYMLATVLHGELAEQQTITIMRTFKKMRHYFAENAGIINRISDAETKLIEHDEKIETIFSIINKYKIEDKQGVFVQGQIFDAYTKFQELIQKAKKEIILIDNYIDLTVLDRLTVKSPGVDVIIYTQPQTPIKKLDIAKFNAQYPTLTIKYTTSMHDRFLIIDRTEIYHIGASLKDLGKKCFGFTQLEEAQLMINTVLNAI